MFGLFDVLLLMWEGRIAYFGPGADALAYLSNLGYEPQPNYNPADFLSKFLPPPPFIISPSPPLHYFLPPPSRLSGVIFLLILYLM